MDKTQSVSAARTNQATQVWDTPEQKTESPASGPQGSGPQMNSQGQVTVDGVDDDLAAYRAAVERHFALRDSDPPPAPMSDFERQFRRFKDKYA